MHDDDFDDRHGDKSRKRKHWTRDCRRSSSPTLCCPFNIRGDAPKASARRRKRLIPERARGCDRIFMKCIDAATSKGQRLFRDADE